MNRAMMPMQMMRSGGPVGREPRITDPRRPTEIPRDEDSRRDFQDKRLQSAWIKYVNGVFDRSQYQDEVRHIMETMMDSERDYFLRRNEDATLDMLDYSQFYSDADKVFPADDAAMSAVTYRGKVPYGLEDLSFVFSRPGSATYAANIQQGFNPNEIFFPGNLPKDSTYFHEGYHEAAHPRWMPDKKFVDEEQGVRSLDYFRGIASNNPRLAEDAANYLQLDMSNPEDARRMRGLALSTMMGLKDRYYEDLGEEARRAFADEYSSRVEPPSGPVVAFINRIFGTDRSFSEENSPFEYMLGEAPVEEFVDFLKNSPAYKPTNALSDSPPARSDIRKEVRGFREGGEASATKQDPRTTALDARILKMAGLPPMDPSEYGDVAQQVYRILGRSNG